VHVPIEDVTLAAEESCDGLQVLEIDRFLRQLKPRQRDIVQSISVDGSSIRETASSSAHRF
jgi:DNA-directed RNA polymerase specialized sigma24 family protein